MLRFGALFVIGLVVLLAIVVGVAAIAGSGKRITKAPAKASLVPALEEAPKSRTIRL